MRVLVLGGYGAVGAPTTAALRQAGHHCHTAGRDPRRADVLVDLACPGLDDYRSAVAEVDAVVNLSGNENPRLAEVAADHGAAFVDATASTDHVERLEALELRVPVLLSVGLAPGLTNLLAADLHASHPDTAPLDLAVVLGAGEAHGRAATAWTLGLMGRSFTDPATGEHVPNLTRGRDFVLPGMGRRRLFRADFSDQHALTRDLGRPVRTHLGLDSRALTRALSLIARLPGAGRLPTGVHLPGSDTWTLLARSGDHHRWARGRGQSAATAALTAWAVDLLPDLGAGVHHLHRVATLGDLPAGMEFTVGASPEADPERS